MSGRHAANPESGPNDPYDVAAQTLPARGETLTVATHPELCERVERLGWQFGAAAEAGAFPRGTSSPAIAAGPWRVALHSPIADKVSQHRLAGSDANGLLALITRKRGDVERRLRRPVRMFCCFEAGYDGFWLHRWLCEHDIEDRVLDAVSLLIDRRARRAKTDRLDAAGLLRTLMALERWNAVKHRSVGSYMCQVATRKTPGVAHASGRAW